MAGGGGLADLNDDFSANPELVSNADISFCKHGAGEVLAESSDFEQMSPIRLLGTTSSNDWHSIDAVLYPHHRVMRIAAHRQPVLIR